MLGKGMQVQKYFGEQVWEWSLSDIADVDTEIGKNWYV